MVLVPPGMVFGRMASCDLEEGVMFIFSNPSLASATEHDLFGEL